MTKSSTVALIGLEIIAVLSVLNILIDYKRRVTRYWVIITARTETPISELQLKILANNIVEKNRDKVHDVITSFIWTNNRNTFVCELVVIDKRKLHRKNDITPLQHAIRAFYAEANSLYIELSSVYISFRKGTMHLT